MKDNGRKYLFLGKKFSNNMSCVSTREGLALELVDGSTIPIFVHRVTS